MKLLWKYLKNYKGLLTGALVLATINQVFSLADPQIFRIIVDKYVSHYAQFNRHDFFVGVILLLLASIGVAFVSRVAKNFQDYYTNVTTQRLGAKLYADSVTHSFSLPYAVFEDQRSGEFLSKLTSARNDSQKFLNFAVGLVFISAVGIIFVLIYATIVHWLVGLMFFLSIPALAFTSYFITKKIKAAQTPIVAETQALAGSTTETLRNVELVKSLGLEGQEINRLNATNETILQLELKKVRLIRIYSFIQGTTINAVRALMLLAMLWLIFNHELTVGEFFTLQIYTFFIFFPLSSLGDVATSYGETKASLEKLEEILAQIPDKQPDNPKPVGAIKDIVFKDVSFGYATGNTHALHDVNLNIQAGKTVAFVGPSGSGKSTMVKLTVGLYQPTEGQVLFNNVPSTEMDLVHLRNRVGLVAQETQLFSGTIRENLLFVKPDATDEECIEALKAASADTLLDRARNEGQDNGLETKIGEGGLKLSGGEKQRLAIARALLRNPDILIFDEATSSLDSITEEQITSTIKEVEKLRPELIRILVAHRLSTIMHADTIYVLEKGNLVEQGTHDELLAKNGLYNALWRQQVSGGE
ncbi:MAG TPA: ABC transporter ATP-binding protein [Patescibacteria group bacterium]|jgi:ATP-binding cassette subfamily B protein|nr:ABC transporter ATP-binding protein [Patescibacteria group bacterium]